jgi:hypothetical protein
MLTSSKWGMTWAQNLTPVTRELTMNTKNPPQLIRHPPPAPTARLHDISVVPCSKFLVFAITNGRR